MDPLDCLKVNFGAHITVPLLEPVGDGGSILTGLGMAVGDSGTDCDTFNMASGVSFPPEAEPKLIRAAIREVIGRFEGRPFSWWLTSGDTPPDLGRYLEQEGLVAAESEVAMAVPLPVTLPMGTGIRIEPVTTPETLIAYAEVQAENWEPRDGRVVEFYRKRAASLLSPDSTFLYFIGRDATGRVVAAGEGCLTDAVPWAPTVRTVGLYGISTRRDRRRQGYGRAICAAILAAGMERGAELAVLQASADGLKLYEGLGFAPIGNVTEYKPRL